MSGILCGHLIEGRQRAAVAEEQVTEEQIIEDQAIDAYREWVRAQFAHDEQRLRQLYFDSTAGRRFGMARSD